jgi:hypothetical protein
LGAGVLSANLNFSLTYGQPIWYARMPAINNAKTDPTRTAKALAASRPFRRLPDRHRIHGAGW